MMRCRIFKQTTRLGLLLILCLQLSCSSVSADEPPSLQTVGWIERVTLSPPGFVFHAKLDTGADSCSVHASNIEYLGKGKKKKVRFTVENRYGDRKKLERAVVRVTRVKTKTKGSQRRPVVRLGVCLAGHYEVVECNLVDRSHFTYPVLMGRNFLSGTALVNSSETYLTMPQCVDADVPK